MAQLKDLLVNGDARINGTLYANFTGTLAGKVNANATAMATIGTAQVRDIYAGTSDMTAGSTALTTGMLYFVYE